MKIKPCPKCGHPDSRVESHDGDYWRCCCHCGIATPPRSSARRATQTWNDRSRSPQDAGDEIERLRAELESAQAELDEAGHAINRHLELLVESRQETVRLETIVDRLPKTADGVPIVPGDVLHFMDVSMQTVLCWQLPENPRGDEIAVANCCPFSGAYSTREAAEKARKP